MVQFFTKKKPTQNHGQKECASNGKKKIKKFMHFSCAHQDRVIIEQDS